ncbi:GTPase-activating protein and VPS9 domain-containing protein 1-like isoform X2 [Littorina saxatilis]|uniref:GTPase-activating protein and VPS9 domain-containing protein 1 n=1 Tax=Littorina saxatilis TaxID=31220 RepID=A0AAN9G4P6_9CAEN
MSLTSDLAELGQHLQNERLFVSTEKEQLQRLYENLRQTSERLLHVAWIGRQQKAILGTCLTHGSDTKAVDVCGRSNEVENTNFVDSYKHFSHHDSKYGDLLKFLWENPATVGQCIYEGEKMGFPGMDHVITTITASVYGGCMFREDESAMLSILKLLTELQVANDDNPRRLLRRGNCAFSLMYKQLCDSLFSARLFLTAALHEPIMRLLMEEEWFYDIDPSKALVRFPPKDRLKRFGEAGTEEHKVKQSNYRTFIVDKLVTLTTRFISSIKANLHCFPPSLAWLVGQVFTALTASGNVDQTEVRSACADLVFALFICPAICDPEPYGITSDIPISHITRHNLMQIAQIIQVLAISHWDDIDPKVKDLYSRFEKGCMSSVLDFFLDGSWDDAVLSPGLAPPNLPMRSAMLMTPSDVKQLIAFLRQTSNVLDDKHPAKKQMEATLATLPQDIPPSPVDCFGATSPSNSLNIDPTVNASGTLSAPDTPGSQRKMFRGKTHKKKNSTVNAPPIFDEGMGDTGEREKLSAPEDVLVITVVPPADCPGMIPEKKVLAWEYENRRRKVKYPSSVSDTISVPAAETQEKRTRFSLSHDQESIGNASDGPEALSEAASSHSVDENELDNFSDMMSANVSGRGSPSISGRDTPLSQAESVEENRNGTAELPVPVPETVQKQNRVDVTDRFGKFELERDEIKSTVSDTWSTDVLASDSETTDQNQLDRLEEVAEDNFMRSFNMLGNRDPEPVSEISETASDAWSTDVLASDTDEKNSERLRELEDQDEVSSIVDRDEADSSLGNEDVRADDDPGLEALGAVGGAPTSDDLGDVFHMSNEAAKPAREEPADTPKKTPFPGPKSLHPPQFHRTSGQGGRQSDPHHVVRNRAWKDRHSDGAYDRRTYHGPFPQRPMNPGVNLWVSTNGQLSGNGATDKAMMSGSAPQSSGLVDNAPPPSAPSRRPTDKKVEMRHPQPQPKEDRTSQDSGNPLIEITEALRSPGSGSSTATATVENPENPESLADLDPADALMLSEQQNSRIDESRLSTALSMFDPFSSEGDGDASTLSTNANNNRSIETLKEDSAFAVSSGAGDNLANMSSRSVDSAIELLCEDDSAFKEVKVNGGAAGVSVEDKGKGALQKGMGSTAPVAGSGAGFLQRDSPDNISLRSDDKDFTDGDESDRANKKGSGFFKTFRDKLHKGIKRKTTKLDKDLLDAQDDASRNNRGEGEGSDTGSCKVETSDDILAKYRTPKKGTGKHGSGNENSDQGQDLAQNGAGEEEKLAAAQVEENTPFFDPSNLEGCFAFQDAKRKLRLVLSMCEIQPGFSQMQSQSPRPASGSPREHELVYLLKAQLAEAVNLQNKDLVTRLHEVIRCIKLFDADGCKKLLKSLREEYRNRAAYISYLVRCRQGLLSAVSHLQKMLNRVERDKEIIGKHLINVCVRLFIERHEKRVLQFIAMFQKLEMADEKTHLVETFLREMYNDMMQDDLWKAASEVQLDLGQAAIERLLMSRIYSHAMFPNADGDILRDQLTQQHIRKLSGLMSPTHKDLRIPRVYHFECPWPAAQHEILMINAYKTPKDKLKCVLRCSQTIMNLLSLANERSVPAADDFMPVLIFVLIKANPPCLLSTIQYVESFYKNRLHGEEQYWWMQFSSAVEFIKTMDYSAT